MKSYFALQTRPSCTSKFELMADVEKQSTKQAGGSMEESVLRSAQEIFEQSARDSCLKG